MLKTKWNTTASKRWIVALTAVLVLGVASGCGDDGDDDDNNSPQATATATARPAGTATATAQPGATPTATVASSGSALNGVAATGAPIDGEVCVVDGDGDEIGCVDIGADGSYSVPTDGTDGPYLLAAIASGDEQTQYSWSAERDALVNINPFTTLSLLLATDYADLDAYFEAWSDAQDEVDAEILADAVDAAFEHFSNQLTGRVPADFDPFYSAFAANGAGFDGVLDGLNFVFDFVSGTVNVNGSTIVINFDPGTIPDGNYRLTLSVSVSGAPTQQVAVIENVPKPSDSSEFCSPEIYNDYFSGLGNFTITGCTFDGNVGRITANVSVSGFNISYVATYTYSPI